AACTIVAIWPVSSPYLRVAREWGADRTAGEAAQYSCELATFLSPPYAARENFAWIVGAMPSPVRGGASGFFPGVLPGLLFLVALWGSVFRRYFDSSEIKWLRVLLLAIILNAVLMLGPVWIWNDHDTTIRLPFALLRELPGMGVIRVPARFFAPLLVCLTL